MCGRVKSVCGGGMWVSRCDLTEHSVTTCIPTHACYSACTHVQIIDDEQVLPCWNGKILVWVSEKGHHR